MNILIRSAGPSFRRGGIKFTRAGVVIDANELTVEQAEAIKSEPMLSIAEAPEGAEPTAQSAKPAAKKAAAKKTTDKAAK